MRDRAAGSGAGETGRDPGHGAAGLPDRFRAALAALAPPLEPGIGLVAVSGGPDSLALLHLLHETRDSHPLELVVGHVDHGIHPDSGAVASRVNRLAESLGLPYHSTRLELGPGTSETAAREARYAWLFATLDRLASNDCGGQGAPSLDRDPDDRDAGAGRAGGRGAAGVVLTAHHAEDQAETVLMRLLRGSGPAGLAGMQPRSRRLVRPLLGERRRVLAEYLAAKGIAWWIDPANLSPDHLRSWIRGSLLPMLEQRISGVGDSIVEAARQATLAREAWDRLLDHLPLEVGPERDGISIASGSLRAYDTALGMALVQALSRRLGHPIGPEAALRALQLVSSEQSGARADLGGGWSAELRFDRLALLRPEEPMGGPFAIRGQEGRARFGPWEVRWSPEVAPDRQERRGWTTWLRPGQYEVRAWQPGDRIRPLGGTGSRLVVRCMQEEKVGRSERSGWPVVSSPEGIIWVPGVCRSDMALPAPPTEAVRIDVSRR